MRLIVLKMKRLSVKNSSEGYTSENWRSMSKPSGVLSESQHGITLVFADTIAGSYRRGMVRFLLLFLYIGLEGVNLDNLKVY